MLFSFSGMLPYLSDTLAVGVLVVGNHVLGTLIVAVFVADPRVYDEYLLVTVTVIEMLFTFAASFALAVGMVLA